DGEVRRRRRAHRDGAAGSGDATAVRIGGRDGLVAGRLQRGVERPGAAAQRGVGGERGGAVGDGEVRRAAVAGGRVVELVLRRDGEGEGTPRRRAARRADGDVRRRRGAHGDASTCAGDAAVVRVGRGDRLVGGGDEGGAVAEVVGAVVPARE